MALWRAVQSDPVMKKCEEDMALLGKAPTWIKGGELVLKPDIKWSPKAWRTEQTRIESIAFNRLNTLKRP